MDGPENAQQGAVVAGDANVASNANGSDALQNGGPDDGEGQSPDGIIGEIATTDNVPPLEPSTEIDDAPWNTRSTMCTTARGAPSSRTIFHRLRKTAEAIRH